MLVIIVGVRASGKTCLNNYLKESGYYTIEASSYYNSIKNNQNNIGVSLNVLTALEILDKNKNVLNHAVLTGIRTVEEYLIIKCFCKNVILVSIKSDYMECYIRAKRRKREKLGTYDEFVKHHIYPDLQIGLEALLNMSSFSINNEGVSMNDFLFESTKILKDFIEK